MLCCLYVYIIASSAMIYPDSTQIMFIAFDGQHASHLDLVVMMPNEALPRWDINK